MRTGEDPNLRPRKRRRGGRKRAIGQGMAQQRRKDNDPLQSFEAGDLGEQEGDGAMEMDDPMADGKETLIRTHGVIYYDQFRWLTGNSSLFFVGCGDIR